MAWKTTYLVPACSDARAADTSLIAMGYTPRQPATETTTADGNCRLWARKRYKTDRWF